jgi:hypothetical protein
MVIVNRPSIGLNAIAMSVVLQCLSQVIGRNGTVVGLEVTNDRRIPPLCRSLESEFDRLAELWLTDEQ